MSVQLLSKNITEQQQLEQLAKLWQIDINEHSLFGLLFSEGVLKLLKLDEPKINGIYVDFISGALAHRRQFGGGRGEAIAKAIGIKGNWVPSVVDVTAGLGRDAFIMASLGCSVYMIERHPVVAALLADGLDRGYQDSSIGCWLKQRLKLIHASSTTHLTELDVAPDVVYIDPMYPHKKKRALVKKEMRLFRDLVGNDADADQLLIPALQVAKKRVVVKRPDYAEPLLNISPQTAIKTKNHRFDIYITTINNASNSSIHR